MVWGIEKCPGRHPLGEWERAARGANVENSVKALLIHCILTFLACVQAFGHWPKNGALVTSVGSEMRSQHPLWSSPWWVRSPQIFLEQSQGIPDKGALGPQGALGAESPFFTGSAPFSNSVFLNLTIFGGGGRKINTQETIYLMATCEYVWWVRFWKLHG